MWASVTQQFFFEERRWGPPTPAYVTCASTHIQETSGDPTVAKTSYMLKQQPGPFCFPHQAPLRPRSPPIDGLASKHRHISQLPGTRLELARNGIVVSLARAILGLIKSAPESPKHAMVHWDPLLRACPCFGIFPGRVLV